MYVIEGNHSEQRSLSIFFRKPSDIKFPADRVRHENLRFSITNVAYPICRKFQAKSFWKGGTGVTPCSAGRCPKDRGSRALLARTFSQKGFPPINTHKSPPSAARAAFSYGKYHCSERDDKQQLHRKRLCQTACGIFCSAAEHIHYPYIPVSRQES